MDVHVGDVVELYTSRRDLQRWNGLVAEVILLEHVDVWLRPIGKRPDGAAGNRFLWPARWMGSGIRRVEFPDLADVDAVDAWLDRA